VVGIAAFDVRDPDATFRLIEPAPPRASMSG